LSGSRCRRCVLASTSSLISESRRTVGVAIACGRHRRALRLVYLSVDLSEQLDRIRRRAKSEPGTTFAINEVELRRFAELFVEPDLDELEGTVIPAPPAEVRSWRDWAAVRWPTSAEG